MDATVWWMLALVVALIVGPFATLRAVSHFRSKPPPAAPPSAPEVKPGEPDDKDPDRPTGFW
ncbi:MAG: hypothetical protein Q8Q73_10665 [Stagnimonas sp.]|nr:hypothetical protein [Stagnimonas sp.]